MQEKDYGLFKFIFMAIYAFSMSAATFIYFFFITFKAIPEGNETYANYILGFLTGTAISSFIGYYFGASQSQHAAVKKDNKSPEPENNK